MNEQAIQDAFALFQQNGYKKSIEDFKVLIKTNEQALSDAHSLFQQNGYKKDINSFKSLMGVSTTEKKNQVGTSTSIKTKSGLATPQTPSRNISVGEKKTETKPSVTSTSKPKFRLPKDEELPKVLASQKKQTKSGDITNIDRVELSSDVLESKKKRLEELSDKTPYKKFAVQPQGNVIQDPTAQFNPASQLSNQAVQAPAVMPDGKTEREYLEELFNKKKTSVPSLKTFDFPELISTEQRPLTEQTTTLEDIGIDTQDFEGFLLSRGIARDIVDREKEGSYSKYVDIATGSKGKLQREIDVFNALMSYIGEKDKMLNEEAKLKLELKEQAGREDIYSVKGEIPNFTGFDQEKIQQYIKDNLPLLYKETQDREEKARKKYDELVKNGTGLYNEKTGTLNDASMFKDMAKSAWRGFESRINNLTATMADKLGMDVVADRIRMAEQQTELFNPELLDYSYVQGKKVVLGKTEYIVDDRGAIYDATRGINVTNILDPLQAKSIQDQAKQTKDRDWSFNLRGTAIQTAGVVGDMFVQIGLTAGAGATMTGATVAQSILGYSSMYENALDAAKKAGLSDSQAEFIANDAGMRGAALYAATTFINPQLGSSKAILGGKTAKEAADDLIKAYKGGGMKSYANKFKELSVNAGSYATSFTREGSKEVFQENIQQVGEIEFINKPINLKLTKKILNEQYNAQDFLQTTILSFISSGLLEGRMKTSSSAKDDFMLLVKSSGDIDNIANILRETGKYKEDNITKMVSDVKNVASNISKIPQSTINNSSVDKIIEMSNKMEEVRELENEKANVDSVFHAEIDNQIESKKEELTQIINKDERQVSDEKREQTADEQTISTEEQKDGVQPQEEVVEEVVEGATPQFNPLKDVESTAKALEGAELKPNEVSEFNDDWVSKRIFKENSFFGSKTKINVLRATRDDIISSLSSKQQKEIIEIYEAEMQRLQGNPYAKDAAIERVFDKLNEYAPSLKKRFEKQTKGAEPFKEYLNDAIVKIKEFRERSEAYHKAKADGSNPELVKAVEELLKPQTDAIQEQTTSEVSVQPETTISQEVEGGKPETELEKTTEEKVKQTKEETISDLRGALDGAIATTKFLTATRRIEDKNLREAKKVVLREVKKRFEGGLPKDIIADIIESVNKLKANTDIDTQLDTIVNEINDIINKNEQNKKVKEAKEKRKQGLKNVRNGRYKVDSTEAKIIAMNPDVVIALGQEAFDVYFEALSQVTTNAQVSPNLGLTTIKAIEKEGLLSKYYDMEQQINQAQLEVNEMEDALMEDIDNAKTDKEKQELIKEFRDEVKNRYPNLSKHIKVSSDATLLGEQKGNPELEAQREEAKELLRDLITSDIRDAVKEIKGKIKNSNSILSKHIAFLSDLIRTKEGDVFLKSLKLNQLTNLYNAVLNMKETRDSSFFMNEMYKKYQIGVRSGFVNNFVKEVSVKGGKLENRIRKLIGNLDVLTNLIQGVGFKETSKGLFNPKERLLRAMQEMNMPDVGIVFLTKNNALYEKALAPLAKAFGEYVSAIKKPMDRLDDLYARIEKMKDSNATNMKLVFHSLSVMSMSNRTNKKIGDIVKHFEYTINQAESSWKRKKIEKIFNEQIRPYIVDSEIQENADGTITINVSTGDKVKVVVVETVNGEKFEIPIRGNNGSLNIKTPNGYLNYLVITPKDFLTKEEQFIYDESRDVLKDFEWMATEAMVYQNNRGGNMTQNYVPMSSHRQDGTSNIEDVITNLINAINGEPLVANSGNLLPLQSGLKQLKLNYIQNIKGVVRGVALQHALKDEAIITMNTSNAVRRSGLNSTNETEQMASEVVSEFMNIATKNSLHRSNNNNVGLVKLINYFYTVALAVVQSRIVDFGLVLGRYSIMNPKSMGRIALKALNRIATFKSDMTRIGEKVNLPKDEVVANLAKNLKVTDSAGFISSDFQSTQQGIMSSKDMRADTTKEIKTEADKVMDKVSSLLFKNSITIGLKAFNRYIASISDTALKRDIFLDNFNDKFKEITGGDFNFEKAASNDQKYLFDNRDAIEEASTFANKITALNTGSSNPLERTLRTNIQSGSESIESLRSRVKRPSNFDKGVDAVDRLFAGFIRTLFADFKQGVNEISTAENLSDYRKAGARITSSALTASLYTGLIGLFSNYVLDVAQKAFVYDDEEEEEKDKLRDFMVKAKENRFLQTLLFEFQQTNKIKGENDEITNKLIIEKRQELFDKMMEVEDFKNVFKYRLGQTMYESIILHLKKNAKSISEDLKEDENEKNRFQFDDFQGNERAILKSLAYLYTEEGMKEPDYKKKLSNLKQLLKDTLLTGNDLNFENFAKKIVGDDKLENWRDVYILNTINTLYQFKTNKEIVVDGGVSSLMNFLSAKGGGGLGRTIPNALSYIAESKFYEMNQRPFTGYNIDVKSFENLMQGFDNNPQEAVKEFSFYLFKKANPAVSRILGDSFKLADVRDNGVSLSKILALSAVPLSQDYDRNIKLSERDVVRMMITKDKLEAPMIGGDEDMYDDMISDLPDVREMTKKSTDSIGKRLKFGGN